MFGLKIAIGAVDNTTAALRGIGSRLKQFSSNVRTWLNLAGIVLIATKIKAGLDKAFSVSAYNKEWDDFKARFENGWDTVLGRTIDRVIGFWGEFKGVAIPALEEIGRKLESILEPIRYSKKWWGDLFSSSKFGQWASKTLSDIDAARIARIRERRQQTTVEENAGINARGRVDPRWMTRPTTLAERIKVRRMQLENQSALDSTVFGQVGLMNERLGRSGPDGTFVSHGFGMNKTSSGFKRYRDTAEAKAERKWQRKVDEARRKESHGVRLSAKMQAVLDQDNADQQAKRDAADKKARDQAILETADNTKRVADTLAGGLSIPPEGGW